MATTKRNSKSAQKRASTKKGNGHNGQLKQPKSPMPAQHQRKPGQEHKLDPRPRYEAPHYVGADFFVKQFPQIRDRKRLAAAQQRRLQYALDLMRIRQRQVHDLA